MLENKLSDKKRLAFTLLSDLGLILFFFGLVRYLVAGADGLGTVVLSGAFLITAVCAILMLTGVISLISQIVRKIGRRITKRQLITGYAFPVFSSLAAFLSTLTAVVLDILFRYETGVCLVAQCEMCIGAFICFLFVLPIYRGFNRVKS